MNATNGMQANKMAKPLGLADRMPQSTRERLRMALKSIAEVESSIPMVTCMRVVWLLRTASGSVSTSVKIMIITVPPPSIATAEASKLLATSLKNTGQERMKLQPSTPCTRELSIKRTKKKTLRERSNMTLGNKKISN